MIKKIFKAIKNFVRLLNEIEQEVIDSQRPSLKPKKTKSERAKEQMRDSYGRFTRSPYFAVYRR